MLKHISTLGLLGVAALGFVAMPASAATLPQPVPRDRTVPTQPGLRQGAPWSTAKIAVPRGCASSPRPVSDSRSSRNVIGL